MGLLRFKGFFNNDIGLRKACIDIPMPKLTALGDIRCRGWRRRHAGRANPIVNDRRGRLNRFIHIRNMWQLLVGHFNEL